MLLRWQAIFVFCLLIGGVLPASAKPLVVVSIKPLALLVAAVADEQVQTAILMPANSSPHTWQMRPADRALLDQANLIIWMGPALEGMMVRMLQNPALAGKSLTLKAGDAATGHDDHALESAHDHQEDPHDWLNPEKARQMARLIAQSLSRLPGVDAAKIAVATRRFEERLSAEEAGIRAQIGQLPALSIFSYHAAFQQFADSYQLPVANTYTLNPALHPGARHLESLRKQMHAAAAPCVITEPQFNPRWWQSLISETRVAVITWDPLASKIPISNTGYIEFQQSLSAALLGCVKS